MKVTVHLKRTLMIVKRTRLEHTNYTITKIVQNSKKSARDLKRLPVTQPSMRNH